MQCVENYEMVYCHLPTRRKGDSSFSLFVCLTVCEQKVNHGADFTKPLETNLLDVHFYNKFIFGIDTIQDSGNTF